MDSMMKLLDEAFLTLPAPWVRHLTILRCGMLAYRESWATDDSAGYEGPLGAEQAGDAILAEFLEPIRISTDNFCQPENIYWNGDLFKPLAGSGTELQRRLYEASLWTVRHQILTCSPYKISH